MSVTNDFKVSVARLFFSSLSNTNEVNQEDKTILYLFIGRSTPWESSPPTFKDSLSNILTTQGEIYSLKRIDKGNISHVIPRITWTENSIYDIYDSYEDISDKNFFVVNSQNQVFKCLHNGAKSLLDSPKRTGVTATSEPIKDINDPNNTVSTPDGYVWKWIYTIPTELDLEFSTPNFIPVVHDQDVREFAEEIPGRIESVKHLIDRNDTTPLENQFNNGIFFTPIKGDGEGAIAEIIIEYDSGFNVIKEVNITATGKNYTYGVIDIDDVYSDPTLLNQVQMYPPSTNLNYESIEYIKPMISPNFGHGYDPISELFSNKLMFSEVLQSEVDFGNVPLDANFNFYGIIKDPLDNIYNKLTKESYYAAESIIIDSVISVDSGAIIQQNLDLNQDTITDSNEIALGVVVNSEIVNIGGVNKTLIRFYGATQFSSFENNPVYKTNTFDGSLPVLVGTLASSYDIFDYTGTLKNINFSNGVGSREYKYGTGEILEIQNINNIKRVFQQSEEIKIIIEF